VAVLGLQIPFLLRTTGSAYEGAPSSYKIKFVGTQRIDQKNNADIHLLNSGSTSRNVKQGTLSLLWNLTISYSLDKLPLETPKDAHEGIEED